MSWLLWKRTESTTTNQRSSAKWQHTSSFPGDPQKQKRVVTPTLECRSLWTYNFRRSYFSLIKPSKCGLNVLQLSESCQKKALADGKLGAFIRELLDEFYALTDSEAKLRAISDEPPTLNKATENAYLAAVAEHLPLTNRICPPDWTQQEGRFLKRPFFPAQLESLKALCIKESPTAFRRRMIFVDANPLSRPNQNQNEALKNAP